MLHQKKKTILFQSLFSAVFLLVVIFK